MPTTSEQVAKPKVVCLCGSTRFGEAFRSAMRAETLAGRIVLTVGLLGHEEGLDMDGPVKEMLDQLHLRKIDLADEVLVLNVGGYVGKSTSNEVEYASAKGKPVRWLEGQAAIEAQVKNLSEYIRRAARDTPLADLPIPSRPIAVLRGAGYRTVLDLEKLAEASAPLTSIYGLGQEGAVAVEDAVEGWRVARAEEWADAHPGEHPSEGMPS